VKLPWDPSRIVVVLALCFVASFGAAPSPPEEPPIRIGHYASMSGSKAAFGDSTDKGIRLAADEQNARGGVLGRRIEVITEDDQSNPDQVLPSILTLLDRHKVDALLGEVSSTLTLIGAPYCQERGIPMITPSSVAAAITKKGDFIFRVCFTDAYQGRAAALFAYRDLGARRVALLVDQSNDYSLGFAQSFAQYFRGLGGQVVVERTYRDGDKDFKAQLTAIAEEHPDAVVAPAMYNDVPNIAKQARALGISAPLVGGDGWDATELLNIGAKDVEGYYFTTHFVTDQPSERVRNFGQTYQEKYHVPPPDALAALGYDAARILFEAISQAGSTEHIAVRDAIASTKNFAGVTGTINMGPDRNPSKSVMVVQIRDGKFRLFRIIEPNEAQKQEGTVSQASRRATWSLPSGRMVAQQLVNGLSLGAIYGLIAIGYTIVYGILRLINFAHGDVFMLAPVFIITMGTALGVTVLPGTILPALATFGLAMALCGAVGFGLDRVAYRPLRKPYSWTTIGIVAVVAPAVLVGMGIIASSKWPGARALCQSAAIGTGLYGLALVGNRIAFRVGLGKTSHLVPLITAIGSSLFLEYTTQQRGFFGNRTRGFPTTLISNALGGTSADSSPLQVGGLHIDRADVLVTGVVLILMIALTFVVTKTRIGLAMRAVSGNRDAAVLMGVDPDKVISFSFMLGGALAGAAGILWATKYPSVDAMTGLMPGLKAFVAAVIGGIGSLPGAVLGGLVMGVSEAFLASSPVSEYKDALAFLLLIAVLLVRPAGLLGRYLPEKV
jgi:branched-chain amino acid transport system substrate-binding protein